MVAVSTATAQTLLSCEADASARGLSPAVALCSAVVGVYAQLRQLDTLLNAWFTVFPCPNRNASAGAKASVVADPDVVRVLALVMAQADHVQAWSTAFGRLPPGQVR